MRIAISTPDGTVYRDMTADEEAEYNSHIAELPEPEPDSADVAEQVLDILKGVRA